MARTIGQEQPPFDTPEDLSEWLSRRMIEIATALSQSQDLEVLYALPAKYDVGMIRYFGGAIATTVITAEGLWIYKSTGWVQII